MNKIRHILEWMYPCTLNPPQLLWKERAIYNWLWCPSLANLHEFWLAMQLLHPQECDISKFRSPARDLYEAVRQHLWEEQRFRTTSEQEKAA